MSPPDPDKTLAGLVGHDGDVAGDLERLKLIDQAVGLGISWAAIGVALGGISGKAAKHKRNQLVRRVTRELYAERMPPRRPPVRSRRAQEH